MKGKPRTIDEYLASGGEIGVSSFLHGLLPSKKELTPITDTHHHRSPHPKSGREQERSPALEASQLGKDSRKQAIFVPNRIGSGPILFGTIFARFSESFRSCAPLIQEAFPAFARFFVPCDDSAAAP